MSYCVFVSSKPNHPYTTIHWFSEGRGHKETNCLFFNWTSINYRQVKYNLMWFYILHKNGVFFEIRLFSVSTLQYSASFRLFRLCNCKCNEIASCFNVQPVLSFSLCLFFFIIKPRTLFRSVCMTGFIYNSETLSIVAGTSCVDISYISFIIVARQQKTHLLYLVAKNVLLKNERWIKPIIVEYRKEHIILAVICAQIN